MFGEYHRVSLGGLVLVLVHLVVGGVEDPALLLEDLGLLLLDGEGGCLLPHDPVGLALLVLVADGRIAVHSINIIESGIRIFI